MRISLSILLVLSLISSISSFGVSSPYWEGHPLTMAAGETKIVNLNLQNVIGKEDVSVKVELKKGLEIASLEKDMYTVKAGTSDTFVPLKIKIPRQDANSNYNISVEVRTITSGGGGTVTLGTGMTVLFDVLVSGKVERDNTKFIVIISSLIILILVILFITLRLRKKKKKKKSK